MTFRAAAALAALLLAAPPVRAQDVPSPAALARQLADGELLLRRGEATAALAPLQAAASADWPCRNVAWLLLGEAQLAANDAASAQRAAAEAARLPGVHDADIEWLRARAVDALGSPDAADVMGAVAADTARQPAQRRGQALVRVAEILEAAGRRAEASRAWRRAALQAPAVAPSDALVRAQELATAAGATFPAVTTSERLALAKALRAANLHERAVAAFRRAEKGLTGAARVEALVLRARSHFDLRQNDEARAACTEVLLAAPGTESALQCRILSARAAWRQGQGETVLSHVGKGLADARLRRFEARAELWLIKGNYYLEQQRLDEAVRAFTSLIAESPRSPKAGEARWRIAWCRMHQSRPLDAAAEFDRLAKEQEGGDLERIGALWAALSRERAGEDPTPGLLAVASRWPWTYQGEQARALVARRLDDEARAQRRAEWQASGRAFVAPPAPALAGDGGARYLLLRDAGLHALALPELEALRPQFPKDDGFAFELARARARAGRADDAQALLRARFSSALAEPSRRSPKELWEVVYPMPQRELVLEQSTKHGIDPALCAAIIRSESSWDPSARSWADARGLMQLVPATAAKLARAEGLAGFTPEQLFDPRVNVALGARHLADLLEQFEGDLDAAIASYNAGEDKVAAWWADFARDGVSAPERVERIPYRETRQYVRRVREAMGWYAWLLAPQEDAP